MFPPIHFEKWIQENQHKLQPPVSNFCLWNSDNFTIMAVGGPNSRTDYHINHTEEYFYQYKGNMVLKIVENGEFKDIVIREGEMFLLPASIPHNPCRFKDTIGIVIEVKRPKDVLDSMRWYCKQCQAVVYEESFYCTDLGLQLKPVIERYTNDEKKRTCPGCSFVNSPIHDNLEYPV